MRVPLTSGWQLGYRDELRCSCLFDLRLSESMLWSSGCAPDSSAERLRVVENGVGISCSPGRSGWPCRLEADQLAAARRRLSGTGRVRPARRSVPRSWYRKIHVVTHIVHVSYVLKQDEDGFWPASAQLRLGVGTVGNDLTAEVAVADLRNALEALLLAEVRRSPHDQAPVRPGR